MSHICMQWAPVSSGREPGKIKSIDRQIINIVEAAVLAQLPWSSLSFTGKEYSYFLSILVNFCPHVLLCPRSELYSGLPTYSDRGHLEAFAGLLGCSLTVVLL